MALALDSEAEGLNERREETDSDAKGYRDAGVARVDRHEEILSAFPNLVDLCDWGSPASAANIPQLLALRNLQRLSVNLEKLLDKISSRRDELRKELDVVLWREKLIELAAARAEQLDECGWDQRLCFGEEEYAEFGSSVLESYEEGEHSAGDAMHVDGASAEEVEWWCRGQKKCVRHAGSVI